MAKELQVRLVANKSVCEVESEALITAVDSKGIWCGQVDMAIRDNVGNHYHQTLPLSLSFPGPYRLHLFSTLRFTLRPFIERSLFSPSLSAAVVAMRHDVRMMSNDGGVDSPS